MLQDDSSPIGYAKPLVQKDRKQRGPKLDTEVSALQLLCVQWDDEKLSPDNSVCVLANDTWQWRSTHPGSRPNQQLLGTPV